MNFTPAARFPADPRVVFILALSVFSGATTLALDAAPQSLEDVMPDWAVLLWGLLLMLGSLVTLVGIAKQNINGILLEQVGSVMVGVTTVFYATVAIYVVGLSALSVVGIVLAWGLACGWRYLQLRSLIRVAYRDQVRAELTKTFLSDLDEF